MASVSGAVVSVVVPTYQRGGGLAELVAALERQTLPRGEFEVVVVDDSSSNGAWDELVALAAASPLPLRVLRTTANGGPAVARNVGWQATAGPFVAFLDDDCVPAPGWLEAGVESLRAHPAAGVVQGRTTVPPGVDIHGQRDWYVWRVVEGPTPSFEGCNIFYRREALAAAGGFDEDIGWWGEDTALGWRVVEAGWDRSFAPDAVAVHAVERRGWRWYLRQGLLETNVVRLAAAHPGFRAEAFWRPWAYRREDAAFALALASIVVAWRWRPALLACLPYVWWQRPSVRRPRFLRLCAQVPLVDAARLAGQVRGAARFRVRMV